MSFASASLEQANIGNIGQIFTGTSAGVTNVLTDTQTPFATITVPPGTYILGYNYSIFDPNNNQITGITMNVDNQNVLSYYVNTVHNNEPTLVPQEGGLSGSNTLFIEPTVETTYTVSIRLIWRSGVNGPSVCSPSGGTNQNNYIYCLKLA